MTTSSSTSGKRSTRRERIARMTLRIVASSLSVGRPTEMRRFCRSFASTRRRRSANSVELNVFSANHLSVSSPSTRLRSARSAGRRVRSTNIGEARGALVRTTTALRASAMILWPTGPSGSRAPSRPVAPKTIASCSASSSSITFAGSPDRVTRRSTRSSYARSPSSWYRVWAFRPPSGSATWSSVTAPPCAFASAIPRRAASWA